ncbi:MAG: hypothetical protein IPM61_11905 [Chlorobi bacterium]|nr:MAG: hypothetical protein UZ07_CHB004001540 [Chlorobi bacterium OLB7]MBK8912018.1 hypothetical protein [Chlorobiota bacterium]MBX7215344.1 hypothetical protein [Candidatus Kapabacteria bacterium]
MIGLTTLLGTAQLATQEALRSAATLHEGRMIVPNFLTVTLNRHRFAEEWGTQQSGGLERFRLALLRAAMEFVESNQWRVGGFGRLVINLLLTDVDPDCGVDAIARRHLYQCLIHDDGGQRTVSIRHQEVVAGREHPNAPEFFVGLRDHTRQLSRQHLRFHYRDLQLTAQWIGSNPTTVNGTAMGAGWVVLAEGDELACGGCRIQITNLLH